jgi:SEC-C motif-containing protein
MRSRYSAFHKREAGYLLLTWHPETRPDRLVLDPAQRWVGLVVTSVSAGGPGDDTGTVEFEASYETAAGRGRLREVSWFERVDGRWTYRSGTVAD